MTTGTYALDKILHIPMEGRLLVWTGIPGHGKSTLLTQGHGPHRNPLRTALGGLLARDDAMGEPGR